MKHRLLLAASLIVSMATANNEATFRLFKTVKDVDDLVIAPSALTDSLGLLYCGSDGQTEKEFQDVLYQGLSQREVLSLLKIRTNSCPSLKVCNTLWFDDSISLKENFTNAAQSMRFHLGSVPLLNHPEKSVQQINAWFSEQDFSDSKKSISMQDISPNPGITIIAKNYFSANWWDEFKPHETEEDLFEGEEDKSFPVEMMQSEKKYAYYEDEILQALSIPYMDSRMRFIILLPNPTDNLQSITSILDDEQFLNILENMEPMRVKLGLPKVSYTKKINWKPILLEAGIQHAFNRQSADFNGINNNTPEKLSIDSIIQDTWIRWDEEGTYAGSGTHFAMDLFGIERDPPKPVIFKANRPFIFMIYHRKNKRIHFMGTVSKQSQMPFRVLNLATKERYGTQTDAYYEKMILGTWQLDTESKLEYKISYYTDNTFLAKLIHPKLDLMVPLQGTWSIKRGVLLKTPTADWDYGELYVGTDTNEEECADDTESKMILCEERMLMVAQGGYRNKKRTYRKINPSPDKGQGR